MVMGKKEEEESFRKSRVAPLVRESSTWVLVLRLRIICITSNLTISRITVNISAIFDVPSTISTGVLRRQTSGRNAGIVSFQHFSFPSNNCKSQTSNCQFRHFIE